MIGRGFMSQCWQAIIKPRGDDMFLTKKGFRKIVIMAICYFIIGSICIITAMLFSDMGIEAGLLFGLGAIVYVLNILIPLWGRYAEGKGKLIHSGVTLVRNELRPAEFIKEYEALKNSNDLVVKKPSVEVLQLVAVAYDSLDDRENALATVDEMVAVASGKKKAYANLIKTSFLFSYNKKEEAEKLFNEVRELKLDFMCKALKDDILKCDRAMAMGDYKTVELDNLKRLEQTFPKLDNLGKLIVHYTLGEVYEKMQDNEKAALHYQYCVDHGGETAIKVSAMEKLQ